MYCVKCGGSGKQLDGTPCSCTVSIESILDDTDCLIIPNQYRGITFNRDLVPVDVDSSYSLYLSDLTASITSLSLRSKNIAICSPCNHGKSIFAYNCIQKLFRRNITCVQLFDVLELRKILRDYDRGTKSDYEIDNPMSILTAPYLFVKIPTDLTWEVFDSITTIIDKRVRQGGSTIFLFEGTWEQLVYYDKKGIVKHSVGDGSYNSILVKSWGYLNNES